MIRESRFESMDGLELSAWIRQPAGRAKGLIAHVHGMGEHSRRYDHLTGYWADHGYASAGFDLRGHGRSAGARGHTPSYELLMDDIDRFLRFVADACTGTGTGANTGAGLPITLYGHSMGGNLVLNHAIRRQPAVERVVASAPYLRLAFEPPAWKVRMAGWLQGIAPALSQKTGLDARALSRDPDVITRYHADPLVHQRITTSFFTQVHAAGESAIARAAELRIPTLIVHGSADAITSLAGSRAFVNNANGQATLEIWDGFFHELHNEPRWEEVAAFVLAWIEREAAHANRTRT